MTNAGLIEHVVILVQENHTTDHYFRGLAPWGANVATDWPSGANPPPADPAHDRSHYFRWLQGEVTPDRHVQLDTAQVLPYYLYLAVTGAFLENHCSGFGTNSTPNHLLIVGGQSPTLRNPPRTHRPAWDMPSLPGLAGEHGVSWACYTGRSEYPVEFYPQLYRSPHVKHSAQIIGDARSGNLPALCMVWHDSPLDEHPRADVTRGMDAIWQIVDAVAAAGLWERTVFLLTYDDWGGWDDHVATPVTEYTPDNVQLAFGPRVPLMMFGGHVRPGIDSRWCSHVSLPKTAIQLLGLPDLGVPRLDADPGLADLVDAAVTNPAPPAYGAAITQPPPPNPTPPVRPLPPPPPGPPQPVGPILLRDGTQLPAPFDVQLPHNPNHPPGDTPS